MNTPLSPIPDDDLSAEEMRQQRRRFLLRRLFSIGLPVLASLAIAAAVAIPKIKDWRARQFTEQAEQLLAQNKLQEAFNNAASAMQMRPGLPDVRRTYAKVLLAAGKAEGMSVLRTMAEDGSANTQDRLDLTDAALRFGDVPLAEREAFQVLQGGERKPEALLRVARVRLAQQKPADAAQALRESLAAGQNADASILLARLQFAVNTPDSTAEALDLLRPLAKQQDEVGLQALLTLVASPSLQSSEGAGWVEALRNHPKATDEQKLAAASAEIQLDPRRYAEIVKRTVAEYRSGTIEQRAQLARWLNQNREYDNVLDVITVEEAAGRSDLFLIRLDALAGRGYWPEIAELLRGDSIPLQVPVVLLYRGRAARELGKPEESATFYRRAVIEAAPTPDVMWYVINYLQRVGEDQVLEQELEKLADNPASARQAFQALVPIVQKRQDAEELYQLYDRMLKRLPSDPAVQNDHRYFATLTGRRADVSGARELVDDQPRMLAYRITLALTHLKNGQPEAAMNVFDGITLDPMQIQPYQRAVLAAVLGANARGEEARQLARSVPGDVVTAQEFELIKPYRGEDN
jgi:tetratricopeptide (TPR) repeat protein